MFLLADKGLPVTTGPICVCKRLTGFNCAGCGMTRSFSACLRFDFYSAMQYNLMGIPLLLGIMIYTFCLAADIGLGCNFSAKIEKMLKKKTVLCVLVLLVLIHWIYNLFYNLAKMSPPL